jgi:hypothetical protein
MAVSVVLLAARLPSIGLVLAGVVGLRLISP